MAHEDRWNYHRILVPLLLYWPIAEWMLWNGFFAANKWEFSLVWGDPLRVAVGLYIWDAPLFGHRGVMLDTSRNYHPVEDILRTTGSMSVNKMNVFHWHITDSHSFPLLVSSEPDLAAKGSYGPDMLYTPDDVNKIVQFGLDHGVRVIPEIDSLTHTGSWTEAYPDIVTCANMFWWPAGSNSSMNSVWIFSQNGFIFFHCLNRQLSFLFLFPL